MAVGAVAVAGVDGRDLLVVAVVDVVAAFGEAAEPGALPPGQNRLPVIGLRAEVGRLLAARHRLEPHDVALLVEDLGAVGVFVGATERRDEEVAVADVALGEDRDRGRRGGRVGEHGGR